MKLIRSDNTLYFIEHFVEICTRIVIISVILNNFKIRTLGECIPLLRPNTSSITFECNDQNPLKFPDPDGDSDCH